MTSSPTTGLRLANRSRPGQPPEQPALRAHLSTKVASGRRRPAWRAWLRSQTAVLAVCCLAQLMVVLDVSVVMVALPQMRQGLGLSVSGQQWVVNAYTLAFAGFLMLGGRAADLFGRKRVFLLGLLLFTLFSLLGGLAQDGAWLVAARAAQGFGGAVLAPATLSLLTTTFYQAEQRRRALGAWSATAASGAAIGVLLGGVLTQALDWRWVLFVNVPIGAALLAIAALAVPGRDPSPAYSSPDVRAASDPSSPRGRAGFTRPGRGHLDIAGAVTVTLGLGSVVYGVVGTGTHPWGSAATLLPLGAGVVLLGIFALVETRLALHPLVPFSVFRRKALAAANATAVLVGAGLFGLYFFLSLFIQQLDGYDALQGGLAYLPAGSATLIAALGGSRLVARVGPRRQLVAGLVLAGAALVWLALLRPGEAYWQHIFGPLVLAGTGFGLSFVPMTMAATTGLPANEAGLAAGLVNTSRQVGGAVGLAAMATIAAHATRGPDHSGPSHEALTSLVRAQGSGYDHAFAIAAVALLAGSAVALLLPRAPRAPRHTEATKGGPHGASASAHNAPTERRSFTTR
jgi:MFS family permease